MQQEMQGFGQQGLGQPGMPMQPGMMQQGMPMQQGMMGGPPQFMGGPLPSAWDFLAGIQNAEVQEKVRWGEVITELIGLDINMANKYKALTPDGQEFLLFIESTDCCRQQMKAGLCADCASWEVDAFNIIGGQNSPFLKMTRECTFTCCCFNRPVVKIENSETKEVIGSIRDPYAMCDLTFSMMDPNGKEVLQAKGGCCQWGLCCQCPCGPCKEVKFDIVDPATQQPVGVITKKTPSILKWCIDSDVENYAIDFQGVTSPQWKAMLLALSVFIDFRYFSNTGDSGDGAGDIAGDLLG